MERTSRGGVGVEVEAELGNFSLYFEDIKFLLGSRHFHIPREVLPISPHLVGFILSRPHPLHEKFSPSRGIYRLKLLIKIIFPL